MKCHWWLQLSPNVPKEDKTFQHIYNSRSTPFTKIYCSSCLGSGQKRYGKAYDKKLQKNSMASKHKHLKALVFPYTFEESVDCHLLSSMYNIQHESLHTQHDKRHVTKPLRIQTLREKSGGTRPPCPPPNCSHGFDAILCSNLDNENSDAAMFTVHAARRFFSST